MYSPYIDTDTENEEVQLPVISGNAGLCYTDPMFPGAVYGGQTTTADEYPGDWPMTEAYSWGSENNLTTNPQIYGQPGEARIVPFANGFVESNTVENFELNGAWYKPRMDAQSSPGPVGFNDYSAVLAAAYTQDNTSYPSPDAMAGSILKGF